MMKKKIRSNKGESLAEVLIAILIIALGLVLLSSLVQVANHIMKTGNDRINEIYNGTAAIEARDTDAKVSGTYELNIGVQGGTPIINSIDIDVYKDEPSGLQGYGVKE